MVGNFSSPEFMAALFFTVGLIIDRSKNDTLLKLRFVPICYGAALLFTLTIFVHLGRS